MTILDLVDEAPPIVPYGEPGYDAFADLWSRFIRPFDVVHTVSCITGLSISVVTQLVGVGRRRLPRGQPRCSTSCPTPSARSPRR